MKKIILTLFLLASISGFSSTLEENYTKAELEMMGGQYMTDLYLFLDSIYCGEDSYPGMKHACIKAYLKELIHIKKGNWAKDFYKETDGTYTKLNIMEPIDPMSCEVTLEFYGQASLFFNVYCDH